MGRSNRCFLLACALLIGGPPALAADKDSGKKAAITKNTSSTPLGETGSLQQTVTAALRAPLPQQGRLVVMSPVNAIRFTLEELNGVKQVALIDARTSKMTRRWTIDAATSAAELADISETVLSDMGLGERTPRANKRVDKKVDANFKQPN